MAILLRSPRRSAQRPSPSPFSQLRHVLFAAAVLASSLLLLASAAQWESPSSLAAADDGGSWRPLDLESLGSANSMAGLEHSMTDRELFEVMATATGPPPPPPPPVVPGLNLVAHIPCAIYLCRPTLLSGISIVLSPDDAASLAALGDVDLTLTAVNGRISFTIKDGVTFTGPSVNALKTQLVGSLGAVNHALTSLLFGPNYNFFGYAQIQWVLTSHGANPVPVTNGTITIVVGSYNLLPSLVPVSEAGTLAGFTMQEQTTSPSFPGVRIYDGAQTPQTVYEISIQSFEGTLNLAAEVGLTFETNTASSLVFTGLPDDVNAALVRFTFTSGAYGAYQGNAGFIIVVTNTFHATTGFIQGAITNTPVTPLAIDGALAAPSVSLVTDTGATVSWNALPAGFVETLAQPKPTSYLLQTATSAAGPFTDAYKGTATTKAISGLSYGTLYFLRVFAVNAGGNSPASPLAQFTTSPTRPGPVETLKVTGYTASSISLGWSVPANTGRGTISIYTVVAQPSSLQGTSLGITTVVAVTTSATLSGLKANTEYTLSVIANNAAGPSTDVNKITQTTQTVAPAIVSYTASGPSTAANTYSNEVTLTVVFDADTNRPEVGSTAALNSLFKFTPSIGSAFSGSWSDSKTLVIDIVNAGSASPVIGTATVQVIGSLLASGGNSAPSTSLSPALGGSFGTFGSLSGGQVLITKPSFVGTVLQDTVTGLGVGINLSPLYADGSYQLVVSVISPKVPGSGLSGSGFSTPGLVVAATGSPTTIQTALDSLLYTPAKGFTGSVSFSFQLLNAATNELLSSLITSVTLKAKAAVPTVTAPESVDVILEQYTAVQGVSVGSTDQSAAALLLQYSVAVSTSHTGSATFSAGVAGVAYSPAQGSEGLSHQLTGSMAALNQALAKLQVKFSFSANSAQKNYAPDPYAISVEVRDLTTVPDDATTATVTTRTINANINCETAAVPASTVTSAQLLNSGNGIVVKIDKPVSDAYLATPVFDCANLLDSTTVGLLGESPVCAWLSTLSFQINFGTGAKFVPGFDSLTIKGGALQRCMGGSASTSAQTFPVSAPSVPLVPSVFISGPKTTSLCNTLVLQGITPMVGGRTPVFAWHLPRDLNPAYTPRDLSGPILEVDPLAFGDGGGNFTFGLTVTNFLGSSSSLITKVVLATNMPVPLIFPTSVTEISQTCTSAVRIYNSITVNPCFSEPLKPMLFSWTILPALPASASGDVVLNTANLVIPPNVLTPGVDYLATLRVSIATNPDELYSEIEYVINIQASELAAYIAGGEWRKVRVDAADWTLDASRSSDPDATSVAAHGDATTLEAYTSDKYSYVWSCTTQTSAACFSTVTGAPLVLPSTASVTLPAQTLKVGLYSFKVVYTHLPSGRSDSTSALIQVREGVAPTPYGALGTVDVLLDSVEAGMVNPNGRVRLMASLPAYYADSLDDLVWTWSILGGASSTGITTATLTESNPGVQGLGTSNLILNAAESDAFFVAGTDYHFKVTVHHRDDPEAVNDAGQAMVYLHINSLPTCDAFQALPSEGGIAFNTSFVVNAQNCYDSDMSELLSYQFFRLDEQGNKFNLLPLSHSPMGRVVLVPTGNSASNYALTVGVTISDCHGGKQEYTKDLKIQPNELVRSAAGAKVFIDGVAALKKMYDETWEANLSITGDFQMLHVIQAAILTELNEIASTRVAGSSNPFSAAEAAQLLAFKKQLLEDISGQAAILQSTQVLQTIAELIEDASNTDLDLMASVLEFVSARAPLEGGASTDQELLGDYLRVVKAALDYIVSSTSSVSVTSGAPHRRLMASSHETMSLATATTTSSTPSSVIAAALATLSLLAQDVSTHSLALDDETFPLALSNAPGFVGAVGRGSAGSAANVSTSSGYGVVVSSTAFSSLAAGAFYDVSVFGLTPVPFIGLVASADAKAIISGGAVVGAFIPQTLSAPSTAVTSFASGDIEVVIPFSLTLSDCVSGSYTAPSSDAAASGNVFGNLCQLGCKVWNGASFSDAGATMVALHPLSKHVVCGLSAPGVVVAYSTVLTTPYVAPAAPADTTNPSTGQDTVQPNGLPAGVVRASLRLIPAPAVYDLNSFKLQFVQDLAGLVAVAASRITVRAVSTTGQATTIIWDFLAPSSADSSSTTTGASKAVASSTGVSSQTLYNNLIALDATPFASTTYLKYTELATISQLCDDGEYAHVCGGSSSESTWSKMELPLIVSICCLIFVCIVVATVYAVARCRRHRANPDSLKLAPPMTGMDLVPAKKFVYTAPNSNSGVGQEKLSEITVLAKGAEFEPSVHSQSASAAAAAAGAEESAASKNRLAPKFPNKAGAAAASAAAAGDAESKDERESSVKSSHHFYYVDESKGGAVGSGGAGSRRPSRSGQETSGVAFSMGGGDERNELSRSGNSQSQPSSPASDQQRRRGSAPHAAIAEEAAKAAEKGALPIVRPTTGMSKTVTE